MDEKTTVAQIKEWVHKMRTDREWVNTPRSLAISVVLEAGELLEHFQWSDAKMEEINREEVESEVADVLIYLSEFASETGIDLVSALKKKLKKIDEKYPADKIKKLGGKFYYAQKRKYRGGV